MSTSAITVRSISMIKQFHTCSHVWVLLTLNAYAHKVNSHSGRTMNRWNLAYSLLTNFHAPLLNINELGFARVTDKSIYITCASFWVHHYLKIIRANMTTILQGHLFDLLFDDYLYFLLLHLLTFWTCHYTSLT